MAGKWTNWVGNQSFKYASYAQPSSEKEVVKAVKKALEKKQNIRVMATGHSFTPIVESPIKPIAAVLNDPPVRSNSPQKKTGIFVQITKVEIFDLRVAYSFDAYALVTFESKQMARTSTINDTLDHVIWTYNPKDVNMRFDLVEDAVRSGKASMETQVMSQYSLRSDEVVGTGKIELPPELAAPMDASGPDLELMLFVFDKSGLRIGRMAVTLHRHIDTGEAEIHQKDISKSRQNSKRPSLQINAKSERNMISALMSEPIFSSTAGSDHDHDVEYKAGDQVVLKKPAGAPGKDTRMVGQVFAKNRDGTFMIKLKDGRVYNRVTTDRLQPLSGTASTPVSTNTEEGPMFSSKPFQNNGTPANNAPNNAPKNAPAPQAASTVNPPVKSISFKDAGVNQDSDDEDNHSIYQKTKTLAKGDVVNAKFKRSSWSIGRITNDRGDSTYDILYDDGQMEIKVPAECIQLKS